MHIYIKLNAMEKLRLGNAIAYAFFCIILHINLRLEID